MNNLLQLKGELLSRRNQAKYGKKSMPSNGTVSFSHVQNLTKQVNEIIKYWEQDNREQKIEGTLISAHCTRIIPKSNRIQALLSVKSKSPSENICGAKFEYFSGKKCHVFTYYVSLEILKKTVKKLETVANIIKNSFNGEINTEQFAKISNNKKNDNLQPLNKTDFLNIVLDVYFIRKFTIDEFSFEIQEKNLVTIYQTDVETKELFSRFGITIHNDKMLNNTTVLLNREELQILTEKAPYLISMGVKDFAKLVEDNLTEQREIEQRAIPSPTNEPIIGVIDTHFNENVYFHEWVEYENKLDENIELNEKDYIHGTAVTSIIVDGPKGNPHLQDNCGRFRVKHFGVATAGGFSSFSILKNIRQIVTENRDIKVWNLSLGSALEIQENSISPEGAELDKIQNELGIIFIVAGTNKTSANQTRIGSPADSLNSIVVNSVTFQNESASYTRTGPVLSFFYKPDVSYYGGGDIRQNDKIVVCCDNTGAKYVAGTSFAAPWVTRKIAFLICKMGLSREIAKALLIDSSAGWNRKDYINFSIGYGIVPKKIDDIITTSDDEIRFIITGKVQDYETYTYNLPIPTKKDKYPFWARVTLAYFPNCNRNQGVDYTSTELDVKFGRVQKDTKLKSIDNNKQGDEDFRGMVEEDARNIYRKWDNVKYICEDVSKRPRPKSKMSDPGLWGLNVTSKERLYSSARSHLNFGIVVTLKEMYGENRFDDFVQLCQARGWLVNKLLIQNQLEIYTQAEQDINLE